MKKIITSMLTIALLIVLTGCFANSDYYKVEKEITYNYSNPIEIDPYETFKDNTDWLDWMTDTIKDNIEGNYKLEVEYRPEESGDPYETFKLTDNNIVISNPKEFMENGEAYQFKFHFINKRTNSKEDMVNFYVIYNFDYVPVFAEKSQVTINRIDELDFLDNIKADAAYDKSEDFVMSYDIYDSEGNQVQVYSNSDISEDVNKYVIDDNGMLEFSERGTYEINLSFTEILGKDTDSGDDEVVDDSTSASEAEEDTNGEESQESDELPEGYIYDDTETIKYTIIVE